MLLESFTGKFLFEHLFSMLVGIDLGVKFLDHMVSLYLTFWEATKWFSIVSVLLYIPTDSVWGF